jgi:hypothetical protein
MKGLIISFLVFLFYIVSTALLSHLLKLERHSKLFINVAIVAILFYAGLFLKTPSNLWFLSLEWQATYTIVDFFLGTLILVLNIHSYIDCFFGFNGGFSTSLVLLLYHAGFKGMSQKEILGFYHLSDGTDKIYGWRLPSLLQSGYLFIDKENCVCNLSSKGRMIAKLSIILKKILNLGKGG